jgi:hypothetical protein
VLLPITALKGLPPRSGQAVSPDWLALLRLPLGACWPSWRLPRCTAYAESWRGILRATLQRFVTLVEGTPVRNPVLPSPEDGGRLRITHAKLSGLAPIGRGKRRVTICAELGTPNEFLNITVDVPGMGTEVEVCERGIERAKVFARQFAELSAEVFPCSDDAPKRFSDRG